MMIKMVKNFALLVLMTALGIGASGALAQQSAPAGEPTARNVIESIQASQQNGNLVVKVSFKAPFDGQIGSFSVASPARVAVDFPNAQSATGQSSMSFNEGDLRSANIVQVADRTRLVLNLLRPMTFTTKTDGKDVLITLASQASAKAGDAAPAQRFAEPQAAASGSDMHGIRDINFRRGKDGEGRVVIDLSDVGTGIDIRQQGSDLIVDFIKTTLPDRLRRKLDVTDFGTPVSTVVTNQQGNLVHMVVNAKGIWEHNAYQTDTQLVLEVKAIKEDPNKLVQGGNGQKYAGEKLSLNFQNIDIRSVLNAIAEFTNFNIVTSDSVTGSLTLRLKDVPWDQALDIILQAKGLDMRKNGGVIWIAPRDELTAKEKLELDSKSQIADLEPIRTESFQINYHSAKAIFDGLLTDKDKAKFLSKRGVVVMDERSNKLIVSDTAARLDDMRRLIQEIDVPVRQVVIEAQIVEASDSFSRNLGARIGTHFTGGTGNGRYSVGGKLADTGYHTGQTSTTPDFISDSLGFNNAAPQLNGKNSGALSLVLWNQAATKFLNLEISALEADGRGKIVSRPRVMTSDQNEALIESGIELPYQTCTANTGCTIAFRKAVLSLKVKPHVTPDGRVAMKVDVNKDSPTAVLSNLNAVGIDTKHVSTDVLVDNGGTVVLGGIYQQDSQNNTSKIPFLGDIPVLGFLFRENERSDKKSELMIFITPRILTDQTASR